MASKKEQLKPWQRLQSWAMKQASYLAIKELPNTEDEITKECQLLNISFHTSSNTTGLDHAEMQRRILAVWANNRNAALWAVAVISACASLVSAIAAWAAVCLK